MTLTSESIVPQLKELFQFFGKYDNDVPVTSAAECVNYLSQDLPITRWEASKFYDDTLMELSEKDFNYQR